MWTDSTIVAVPAPFSLEATVRTSGIPDCMPMCWCQAGGCFQLIERMGDKVYRVSVTEHARAARSVTLRVTVEAPDPLSPAQPNRKRSEDHRPRDPRNPVTAEMITRVRRILSLDPDLTGFYELCRDHSTLHTLPHIGAGRTVRTTSLTEGIIKAICWTNVAWPQAVKMINRLGQLGPTFPHAASLHAWPTPREILRAGDAYLTQVCRLGYRSTSILRFCREVCDGRFDADEIERLAASPDVPSDELVKRLRRVHGVGPSSAHYMLSFLGRHDRLATDSSTVAHVRRTHTNGRKPTFRQIERIYAPFGRWKNLVWWFEYWLGSPTGRELVERRMVQGRSRVS